MQSFMHTTLGGMVLVLTGAQVTAMLNLYDYTQSNRVDLDAEDCGHAEAIADIAAMFGVDINTADRTFSYYG